MPWPHYKVVIVEMNFMKRAWFKIIAFLTREISYRKQRLLGFSVVPSILSILLILLLEIFLGVVSFPLYFIRGANLTPELFNQQGFAYCLYRVRRKITLSTTALFTLFLVAHTAFTVLSFMFASGVQSATVTWDGGGGDQNWSTAANWSTDSIPDAADVVLFDGTTATSSIIDAGFAGTIAGIQIDVAYLGTITQARSLSVTGDVMVAGGTFALNSDTLSVGGTYSQTDGVFTGSSGNTDFNGDFSQTGGTFTASSASTTLAKNFTATGGTFNHNNGDLVFDAVGEVTQWVDVNTSLSLNNLSISQATTGHTLQFVDQQADRLVVSGTLDLIRGRTNGGMVIEAQGPVFTDPGWVGSNGTIYVTGPARTITIPEGVVFTTLSLNSSGTEVNLSGTNTTTFYNLIIQDGTFNSNSANLEVTVNMSVSGSGARFVGGSGNVWTLQRLIASSNSSVEFGTGLVYFGYLINIQSGATVDMTNVSSANFSAALNSAVNVITCDGNATFRAPATTLYIGAVTTTISNFNYIHNNGTVVFSGGTVGNNSQFLVGEGQTFYNLTKAVTSTATFTLEANATTTVAGRLSLSGVEGGELSLRSNSEGTQTAIDPGALSLSNLDFQDIANASSTIISLLGMTVEDSGNNARWSGLQDTIFPTVPGDLTVVATSTDSVLFGLSTTTTEINFSEYKIYYKLGSSGVTVTDSVFTDANFSAIDFSSATSTLQSGLVPSGQYVANIWAYDTYGNYTPALSEVTFFTKPAIPTNLTANVVTTSTVSLSWTTNSNSSTVEYYISEVNNSTINSGWITSTSHLFSSLNSGSSYNFHIKSRNGALEESEWADSLLVQTQSLPATPMIPDGGGAAIARPTITINNGASETLSREVTLTVAPDGAVQFAVSNLESFEGVEFRSVATSLLWTLTEEAGTKIVYARFKFADGQTIDYKDSIVLVNPVVPVVVKINNDESETAVRNVTLSFLAPGASQMAISNLDNFAGVAYIPYSSTANWVLTDGEGSKTVYVRFVRADGTVEANDSIYYRPSITVVEAPTSTTSTPKEPEPSGPRCGNGILEISEECDDGNMRGSDGCNAYCALESLPIQPEPSVGGGSSGQGSGESGKQDESVPTLPGEVVSSTENKPGEDLLAPETIVSEEEKFEVPQTSSEPMARVSEIAKQVVVNLGAAVKSEVAQVAEVITKVTDNPVVENTTKKVVAPVSVGVTTIAFAPILAETIIPLLRYIFLQPIMLLGLRRRKEWGVVYNSLTKTPIDLALVRLIDANTNRLVQSVVTDTAGRYIFFAKRGTYRLEVRAFGYIFPTRILSGVQSDGDKNDLYHWSLVNVLEDGMPVGKNIPLDPEDSDQKNISSIRWKSHTKRVQHLAAVSGIITTGVSFAIAPSVQTGFFLAGHIMLNLVFIRYTKSRQIQRWGMVKAADSKLPVAKAIVRLYDARYHKLIDTYITDGKGRYGFLAGNNSYYVTVSASGYEDYRSEEVDRANKNEAFISREINLQKVNTSNSTIKA